MKKENIFGMIMYLIIFAFAVVYGLTVLQTHFSTASTLTEVWQYAIYIIASILVGIILSALLSEFGHLLGAKVGGYNIYKFTVLYFTIYKDKDKTQFGFKNFDGMTGETLIVPNPNKKSNPLPFLIYGPVFNLTFFVGCLVLFFYFNNGKPFDSDVAYALLTIGIISGIIFIYDIVPVKLDTTTNGYRLFSLLKSKDYKSFNDLLTAEYNAKYGVVGVEQTETTPKENPVVLDTAEGKLIALYSLIDEKKFEEAEKLLNEIFDQADELSKKSYLEVQEHRIYIKIMTLSLEDMTTYYDNEVPLSLKREISSDRSIIGIRTYLLMAGLLDKSRSECLIALNYLAKAYKNTPSNRKHAELVLFNEALEKVCQAHPKWELDIYKLYE